MRTIPDICEDILGSKQTSLRGVFVHTGPDSPDGVLKTLVKRDQSVLAALTSDYRHDARCKIEVLKRQPPGLRDPETAPEEKLE